MTNHSVCLAAILPILLSIPVGCSGGLPSDNGVIWPCVGQVSERGAGDLPDQVAFVGQVGTVCANPDVDPREVLDACEDQCKRNFRRWGVFVSSDFPFVSFTEAMDCDINPPTPNTNQQCHDPVDPAGHGPSMYTTTIGGPSSATLHVDQVGDGTATLSGTLRYSIPMSCNSASASCVFLAPELRLTGSDFAIGGKTVTGILLDNEGDIEGTIATDGTIVLPPGSVYMTVNFDYDNGHGSMALKNQEPLTGTLDRGAGTFSMSGTFSTSGVSIDLNLRGTVATAPAIASISVPATVECDGPRSAAVTLDGSSSSVSSGKITNYVWAANGTLPLGTGATLATRLPLGSNAVQLTVIDSNFGGDSDFKTVEIVDTTAPTLAGQPWVNIETCSPDSQVVTIPVPAASDVCTPDSISVVGNIISKNGTPLSSPIPIANGKVALVPGVYVAQFVATDGNGRASSLDETVNVVAAPALYASNRLTLDDNVSVLVSGNSSLFGPVESSGKETTTVGANTKVGDLLSVGKVWLRSGSSVHGTVRSLGTIEKQDQTATVPAGQEFPNASFSMATFPSLTADFGAPSSGDYRLEPDKSGSLSPGRYSTIEIKSRAKLTIGAGSYVANTLRAEPDSQIVLSNGPVQIYVRDSLALKGKLISSDGSFPSLIVGYAGLEEVFVGAPFSGRIVAPKAKLSLQSQNPGRYEGEFFAKDIEVFSASSVIQHPVACSIK